MTIIMLIITAQHTEKSCLENFLLVKKNVATKANKDVFLWNYSHILYISAFVLADIGIEFTEV